MRHKSRPAYVTVVTTREALDHDPPRAVSPLRGISDDDWQSLFHTEAIWAGEYDWYVRHGGAFLPDAALKAQGRIPADWSAVAEIREARLQRLRERHEGDPLMGLAPTDLASERHARAEYMRQQMHALLDGELDDWLFEGTMLDPQRKQLRRPLTVVRSDPPSSP